MTAGKLISQDAGNLIIEQEVSSRAAYTKKYQRPERPGGESGITIGIGYDCGYSTPAQLRKDWAGRIPVQMIDILATRAAGLKGQAAAARLPSVQPLVSVPWEAAISEFYDVEVPRWVAKCRSALPNFDSLPPDCAGALVSLAYNRGPSFTIPASKDTNGRYAEMRAIRALMVSKQFSQIPAEFRKMKRLWTTPSVRGVATRREAEAKLFERGLKAGFAAPDPEPVEVDQVNRDVVAPPNVQPVDPTIPGDPVLFDVQQRLKARRYPPGVIDGKWGSGTRGALSGFMGDRGHKIDAPTSLEEFHEIADEVRAELLEAETEPQSDGSIGWFRPVSQERANADSKIIKELAPEVAPVKRNFLTALGGSIVAFFSAAWDTVSGWVSEAWNFFTDHKDVVDDNPGIASTVWGYVSAIPTSFWLIAGGCGLAFIAYNSWRAIKTSTQAVQNGERQ